MRPAISPKFLHRYCSHALAEADRPRARVIIDALGPLAARWAGDDALRLAGLRPVRPTLQESVKPGEFGMLVAVREGDARFPVLRPAFVLPLAWRQDTEHSRRLPASLHTEAERVLQAYAETSCGDVGGRWGLHLSIPECEDFDMSGIDIDAPSGFAAMLAAVDQARLGVAGVGTVLASVACLDGAVAPVECVAAKLEAAFDAGAKTVFLCDGNRDTGAEWERLSGRAGFVSYLSPSAAIGVSLAPFMRAVRAAPAADASIAEHRDYVEGSLCGERQGEARRDYYLARLAKRLATDHVSRFPSGPRPGQRRCLVGVVSPRQAPTLGFLAHVFSPEAVLLIYEQEQAAADVAALRQHLVKVAGISDVEEWSADLAGAPLDVMRRALRERIEAFCREDRGAADGSQLVCDLTAGLKRLSFALLDLAPPQALCVHVDAERSVNGLHRIGTEHIQVIQRRSHS